MAMLKSIGFIILLSLLLQNASAQSDNMEDPYLWLEEIESEEALEWVVKHNQKSDKVIVESPLFEPLKEQFLSALNDKEKIAYPKIVGNFIYNFWQDEGHVRGIWRRITKEDFVDRKQNWETVLDLDQLSKEEGKKWVFDGATWLEPENKRCLIALSDGGKDENFIREFNAETKSFVKDGFSFDESKGGVNWLDQNTLIVTRDFGDASMSSSGYPRQSRLLKRGETLENAKLYLKMKKLMSEFLVPPYLKMEFVISLSMT